MAKNPEDMKLWEHAEAWWSEQGKTIPQKNSPAWEAMYQEWVEFAFQDFAKTN